MAQSVLGSERDVMSQLSFSDVEFRAKRKKTKREIFLDEMDSVVPWDLLIKLIEPVYPKSAVGRPAYALSSMVRAYCMQQWFGLSDPAMEKALYEIASMRRFAGLSKNSSLGEENTIFADAGYRGAERRTQSQAAWHIAMRPGKRRALTDSAKDRINDQLETLKARVRAKVEHPFRVIKIQFGFIKARYRGMAKNRAQLHMLCALVNPYTVRRRLMAMG